LRGFGIVTPYSEVIYAEYVKGISIDQAWQAHVNVQQKLVFLQVPERGDLFDVCPLDPKTTFENFRVQSPDSQEIGRRRIGRTAAAIDWEPRARITPYAIYDHHVTWSYPTTADQLSSHVEFKCEGRTGTFLFEMAAPQSFDAAVVFERPRWTNLTSERRLVKYALKLLDSGAERATLADNGQRVEWKITGPKIGAHYMCVIFHHNGVLLWKDKLEKTSLLGGVRQLFARFAR
jgi:hypothetical protein